MDSLYRPPNLAPSVQGSRPLCSAQLLLAAPKIAGLLPASVPSQAKPPPVFTFTDPRLAEMPAEQCARLFDATRALLAIALDFGDGGLSEEALRAAEVVFHRAAGGQSVVRPLHPKAYNAEFDADLIEWRLTTTRHMKEARENAIHELEQRYGPLNRDDLHRDDPFSAGAATP